MNYRLVRRDGAASWKYARPKSPWSCLNTLFSLLFTDAGDVVTIRREWQHFSSGRKFRRKLGDLRPVRWFFLKRRNTNGFKAVQKKLFIWKERRWAHKQSCKELQREFAEIKNKEKEVQKAFFKIAESRQWPIPLPFTALARKIFLRAWSLFRQMEI